MKEIGDIIRFWEARAGDRLALATLVAARGSSYRRPGARMLVDARGESAGGVSAGCIEDEVVDCARRVVRNASPELLTFDTRLRFGCHGAIDILVEPVRDAVLAELRDSLARRQSCSLETILVGEPRGTRVACWETTPGAFVQRVEPVLRLILLGDGSDTAALRAQAALMGWEVLQVDAPPPRDFLDERTAVVIATHHFGRDCAALRELLPAGLKYLGVIGSRRRRDDILFDVLHDHPADFSTLFAPAGLHLGGDSPEEMALAVVAEIQSVFAGGDSGPLRHRKGPIHECARGIPSCTVSPG